MNIKALVVFVTGLSFYITQAQISPAPHAKLNHTQIMFEYAAVAGANQYLIQLIEDTVGSSFQHPLLQQKDSSTATLISGLHFGKKYLWRYKGNISHKWQGPFGFEIAGDLVSAKNKFKIKIQQSDTLAKGLIVLDYARCIINRSGEPVLYLKPESEIDEEPRDFRLNKTGTITYMLSSKIAECDLNSNTLWQKNSASDEAQEAFHHYFKRLPNGHFMTLSSKNSWLKIPAVYLDSVIESQYIIEQREDGKYASVEFGTILEYNKAGEIVWSWNAESYFKADDLFAPRSTRHAITYEHGAHLNAASLDMNNEFVYAGFRNISRVIKINKKTGEVVSSWGDKMPGGEAKEGDGFFYLQHDANILNDSNIAVYNNDDFAAKDKPSSVVVFTQPIVGQPSVISWKYDCVFDHNQSDKSYKFGNVDELPNTNFLVCMGTNGRVFEVTRNKQIVWNCTLENAEQKDTDKNAFPIYRAHYTSSLYPCYFTAQADRYTLSGKSNSFNLKIFNEGTEDDTYTITVTSTSKNFEKQLATTVVPKGKSYSFDIELNKQPVAGETVEVVVKSTTNPGFERKLKVAHRQII